MEKILEQLRKFDEVENAFGEELINAISYGVCSDGYVVKVHDYPYIELMKDNPFESNYFSLISYLTDIKNRIMNGSEPKNETKYYHDWLDFKMSYNVRKAWFYLNVKNADDPEEVTELLLSIIGTVNSSALIRMFRTSNLDYRGHFKNVMIYIGNTRAIRDISRTYLDPKYGTQWQFHLWHMMAYSLVEEYGDIFYLGNELSSLEYCPYTYKAKEYYYEACHKIIYENTQKNIPKNRGITQEQRKKMYWDIQADMGTSCSGAFDDSSPDFEDDFLPDFDNHYIEDLFDDDDLIDDIEDPEAEDADDEAAGDEES